MIKIEKIDTYGWEAAVRGARNPMNSWDRSDSHYCDVYASSYFHSTKSCCCESAPEEFMCPGESTCGYILGKNDLDLLKRLSKAGNDHGKFMRMISVTMDITAPLYWVAEHDTYKVGTTRNSCSFMHKGVSKPFSIDDFSIRDERVKYLINDLEKKTYELKYPYDTDEYKIYETKNGRKYKVFKNGKVFSCPHSYKDSWGTGRIREFGERECKPSRTAHGYFELKLGSKGGEKWQLHRLVAYVWHQDTYFDGATVDHINADKGDNSAENLRWVSLSDNIKSGFENGLFDQNKIHSSYIKWKNASTKNDPLVRASIRHDKQCGMSYSELSEKYNLNKKTLNNIIYTITENEDLFMEAYFWEKIIQTLNLLRDEYLSSRDPEVFAEIRKLLPSGYNVRYTWSANYAVLKNIYHARKDHKLDEWKEFCKVIEKLPYSELITGEEK